MNPTLDDIAREAYSQAPVDPVLHTLEIRHSAFTAPIRVVRDRQDHTLRLENEAPQNAGQFVTFTRFAFEFVLPKIDQSGTPKLQIAMDNVDRVIRRSLDQAIYSLAPVEVLYRPYLASNAEAPIMSPILHFEIESIDMTPLRVTAVCRIDDLVNKQFPGNVYTVDEFPGLRQ